MGYCQRQSLHTGEAADPTAVSPTIVACYYSVELFGRIKPWQHVRGAQGCQRQSDQLAWTDMLAESSFWQRQAGLALLYYFLRLYGVINLGSL